jgi:hypothetical protein
MMYTATGFTLVLKKLSRDLPIIRRHLAITSHDQVKGRRLDSLITALMVKQKKHNSERVRRCLQIATVRYLSLVVEAPEIDPEDATTPRKDLLIKDFSLVDCNLFFRFQREHLYLLLELLKIPWLMWQRGGPSPCAVRARGRREPVQDFQGLWRRSLTAVAHDVLVHGVRVQELRAPAAR